MVGKKKLGLAPLLLAAVVMVVMAVPAMASAAPIWKIAGKAVTRSTAVKTHGKLTLTSTSTGATFTCTVTDKGTVNTAGKDEITEFVNSECTTNDAECPVPTVVTPTETVKWATQLTESSGVIRDTIEKVEVIVKCDGTAIGEFTGILTPKIVNNSPTYAEFGTGSGHLTSATLGEATVTGTDAIEGVDGEKVEVEA